MPSKKFTFEFGTLHVKTKYDEASAECPFQLQYRTKKNGITMRLAGSYTTEQVRDAKYAAFKRADAEPFLRGMQRVLDGAGKSKKAPQA